MNRYIKQIIDFLDIHSEIDDVNHIHDTIVKDSVFKGTNLWILFFAILVASVGLNVNSTAVIIGAMLISPLMGPINGIGYSIATYDFVLFKSALKNLAFAVITGLIASWGYFALSPLSQAHSELLARTSPSIYDVLIAMFGGLAGIVATSSRQKGNVLPGVAIATALMPPLCTAGYGLATAQFHFFTGALYLFTINTVFIALAAALVSQWLKFPIRGLADEGARKRVNTWITIVIVIVLLPSIYFGYKLVQKEQFSENAQRYVESIQIFEGTYLLKHQIDADNRSVVLVYGGLNLNEEQKERLRTKAKIFELDTSKVVITQGLSFVQNSDQTLDVELLNLKETLRYTRLRLDSMEQQGNQGSVIRNELKALYPEVQSLTLANTRQFNESQARNRTLVLVKLAPDTLTLSQKNRIKLWLKTRTSAEDLFLYFETEPGQTRKQTPDSTKKTLLIPD